MKNKILPFSVIIIFGIIFFIFYKGLEDSKIYTPNVNIKKEIPVFNSKEFFSGENVKSSSIFESDKFIVINLVQNQDFFNVRYQVKPFMLWIWLSVILISFAGIVSFLQKKS